MYFVNGRVMSMLFDYSQTMFDDHEIMGRGAERISFKNL